MTEAQNNKDVYKKFNNAHYQLLDKKDNFSLLVNMALGREATTPSTLHSCDSREIALISKATEKAIEENEENDIRSFKFHSLERKNFGAEKKDGKRADRKPKGKFGGRDYDEWNENRGGHERFDRSGRKRFNRKEGKGGPWKNNNQYDSHDDED